MLNDRDIEILKNKLIAIADHELSIEKQRQYLARLEEFEPYATFIRLDRNNNGFLTAKEIHSFLKDNGMAKLCFEDWAYLIKFYDSDEDGVLNYTDYMQWIITWDDAYLRAAVTQRDPYGVNTDEYLSPILERELAILFQKELAYHHEINSFPNIPYDEAFKEIDEEHLNFIDGVSIEKFLRRCGFNPTEEEITAIIRRIDVSADALISYAEFEEAMRPVKLSDSDLEFKIASKDKQNEEQKYSSKTYTEFSPKLANPSKIKIENLMSGYYGLVDTHKSKPDRK